LIGPPAAADPAAWAEADADPAACAEAEATGLLAVAELAAGALDGAVELVTDEDVGAAAPPQAASVSARTTPGSRLDVRNMMLSAPTGSSGY